MSDSKNQKRFTVSIDEADYVALCELGNSISPPLNMQYLMRLAVRNLIDQNANKQLTLPLGNAR